MCFSLFGLIFCVFLSFVSRTDHVFGVRNLPARPKDPAEDGLRRGAPEGGGRGPGGASGGKWRTLDKTLKFYSI